MLGCLRKLGKQGDVTYAARACVPTVEIVLPSHLVPTIPSSGPGTGRPSPGACPSRIC